MKLINLLVGVVIFLVGLSLMFSFVGDIFKTHGIDDNDVFSGLAQDYVEDTTRQTDADSNIQDIADATESGPADSEDKSIFILTGGIEGGRLILNQILNFDNIVHNVSNTLDGDPDNPAPNYIDSKIVNVVIALASILIIIISIQMIRGFKLET